MTELLPYQKKILELVDHTSKGGKIAYAPRCHGRTYGKRIYAKNQAELYEKIVGRKSSVLK